jgi:hypothetical protein
MDPIKKEMDSALKIDGEKMIDNLARIEKRTNEILTLFENHQHREAGIAFDGL